MSANFYNNWGMVTGVDVHFFIIPAKPPILPWPLVFGAPFEWVPSFHSKRTESITSMDALMIQGGFDLYLVIHVPLGPPPGAIAPVATMAKILALSGSKAQLAVQSVTGEGGKLACCIVGMLSKNVECNDPIDMLTGNVLQLNTVQTQPTAGDYASALASYAVDAALGWGIGKGIERGLSKFKVQDAVVEWFTDVIIKHVWRRTPDVVGERVDLPSWVGDKVQKWIDGEK
ncbi:hypothetical protein [Chondromyces crocatus]|uniref:Uncharacterized protein n=1 Tax=Chondromyces crocatus TaxID=52 RepID=A0A0K1EGK1_CHOCO|nr:hypothetical protein [Chondromyces crocatus]AKT39708.1 uncharacterized protein CMC5_038570 [Chondromyces crocatus]